VCCGHGAIASEEDGVSIDDPADLTGLLAAGRVVRAALEAMRDAVRPGITTRELDDIAARVFVTRGARSAPVLVYGFPGATCISVNDEIVHGIPSRRTLHDGDLVKLDVTVEKDGYMADAAITVGVGRLALAAAALAACAERALAAGLAEARAGNQVRDIGRAVERVVRTDGFHVVRPLTGHGIGRTIHEDPLVPNYDDPDATAPLTEGLVITVEPIIAASSGRMRELDDGWTIVTADRALAAHAEHTIVVRHGAPQIVTAAA
jgi:methionyl aminopeptidase